MCSFCSTNKTSERQMLESFRSRLYGQCNTAGNSSYGFRPVKIQIILFSDFLFQGLSNKVGNNFKLSRWVVSFPTVFHPLATHLYPFSCGWATLPEICITVGASLLIANSKKSNFSISQRLVIPNLCPAVGVEHLLMV